MEKCGKPIHRTRTRCYSYTLPRTYRALTRLGVKGIHRVKVMVIDKGRKGRVMEERMWKSGCVGRAKGKGESADLCWESGCGRCPRLCSDAVDRQNSFNPKGFPTRYFHVVLRSGERGMVNKYD